MSDYEREIHFIDASEIGEYSYCHRQWWLRRVEGIAPLEVARMEQGTAYHRQHWQLVHKAARNERLVPVLVVAVLSILLVTWLLLNSGIGG